MGEAHTAVENHEAADAGATPVPRDRVADRLRGFALLGIVVVNVAYIGVSQWGFDGWSTGGAAGELTGGVVGSATAHERDQVAQFLVGTLAEGKFYLLFSFLFGYSLSLMLRGRGSDGVARYRRRLVGLAALGLAHGLLFFTGDILMLYAVVGAVLLRYLPRADRELLRSARIVYGIGAALLVPALLASWAGLALDDGVDGPTEFDSAMQGSFGDALAARAGELPWSFGLGVVFYSYFPLSMFLLGVVAGRRNLLTDPQRYRQLWRRCLWVAGLIGLPLSAAGSALYVWPQGPELVPVGALVVSMATAPLLTAGYVAAFALTIQRPFLAVLEPAGRMSLSIYLGQSIVLCAIFCGWGLGLYGQLTALPTVLVAIAVWVALVAAAHLWLRRFAYGPFEWLLRAWTYQARPPLLRRRLPEQQATGAGA